MNQGKWTLIYIGAVALINYLFLLIPMIEVFGAMIPPVMLIVGFIFVFRDFAQREIGHWVVLAMLIAGLISYFTSAPYVAIASVTAFLISESIDWGVYSFTKRPLSERILYSSAISVPIDTIVFLKMVGLFGWRAFIIVSLAKMIGAVVFWIVLRRREHLQTGSILASESIEG